MSTDAVKIAKCPHQICHEGTPSCFLNDLSVGAVDGADLIWFRGAELCPFTEPVPRSWFVSNNHTFGDIDALREFRDTGVSA